MFQIGEVGVGGRCRGSTPRRWWLQDKNAEEARRCSRIRSRRPYSTAVEDFPHLSRFALELESLPAMSALFPGYKQVEAFGPDEDYESNNGEVEEEVEYVTLDLGTVEPTLVPSSSSYRLIVSCMYTLLLHSC